ncbi:MAG: hypothetical protein M3Q47_15645 [Actinomycetota bacterium]|nr:hypothetical protein [Actinomycetota bacterium]
MSTGSRTGSRAVTRQPFACGPASSSPPCRAGRPRGGWSAAWASPALDLSAYRILQEALTNALRHSGDRAAQVRVVVGRGALDICVENVVGPDGTAGSGLGLVGVAERVAVFAGRLEHGPTGDGRYALRASLPLARGDR